MSLRVLEPGLLTTVQDLGRYGHQRDGVPVSGAMDQLALRVANLLVGNDPSEAALEVTLAGPALRLQAAALLAVTGADLGATLDGVPLPPWRAAWAPEGATLAFGAPRSGCRAYVAVAGGITTPPVLGSRSTFVRAGLGGVEGRALRKGDVLPVGEPPPLAARIAESLHRREREVCIARWGAGPTVRPAYSASPTVRLIPGAHAAALTTESRRELHRAAFRVSPQSDRTGFRLDGPRVELAEPLELLSEAVTFGTVQLPAGGEPIVLMADRQTTGGYPRIGEVASVDLPLLAQLRPGDRLTFRPVSLSEAQTLAAEREQGLRRLRQAILLTHR